jgi:hypothetical protein
MFKKILAVMLISCNATALGFMYSPSVSLPVSVLNGGTGVTTSTGSGSAVLSVSPSLTTPSIGAATFTQINSSTGGQPTVSSNGNAAIGSVNSKGMVLVGKGSASDITLQNNAGTTVANIPTGTTNLNVVGAITASSVSFSGGSPTVSSCGTSPSIDSAATNGSGRVTVGTVSATSCTITFLNAFTVSNHCNVTSQGVITGLAYSYTLSAITVTGTSLVGDVIDYRCDGS